MQIKKSDTGKVRPYHSKTMKIIMKLDYTINYTLIIFKGDNYDK